MSKYFYFYPEKWLGGRMVKMLSLKERGAFIQLLAYMWENSYCGLPDNDDELSVLSDLRDEWFTGSGERIRKHCLTAHPEADGYLTSDFLYENRKLVTADKERKSEVRKKAADARWNKNKSSVLDSKCNANAMQNDANIKSNTKIKQINIPFADFWNGYDKKDGSKSKADEQWGRLTDAERTAIMAGVKRYAESFAGERKQYQPYATTFLNQRRWESEEYGKAVAGKVGAVSSPNEWVPADHYVGFRLPPLDKNNPESIEQYRQALEYKNFAGELDRMGCVPPPYAEWLKRGKIDREAYFNSDLYKKH